MADFENKILIIREKGKELIKENNEKKLYNFFVRYINKNKIFNKNERLNKMLEIYTDKINNFLNNNFSINDILEEKNKENKVNEKNEININLENGEYKCKFCNSYKTYYRSSQTKSSDEGMTIFIHCSECFKIFNI